MRPGQHALTRGYTCLTLASVVGFDLGSYSVPAYIIYPGYTKEMSIIVKLAQREGA